jgi:hypothetical protein
MCSGFDGPGGPGEEAFRSLLSEDCAVRVISESHMIMLWCTYAKEPPRHLRHVVPCFKRVYMQKMQNVQKRVNSEVHRESSARLSIDCYLVVDGGLSRNQPPGQYGCTGCTGLSGASLASSNKLARFGERWPMP